MARQFAMAMELPFLLVGSVLLGGFLGVLLDRWLGTKPYLMLVLGGIGFFAGIREVLRRLPKDGNGNRASGSE